MQCHFCGTSLQHTMIDLGFAPPSNALLTAEDLNKPETYYPLRVMICHNCWLAQTEDFVGADKLFKDDYPYFSSTSKSYLEHCQRHAKNMIGRLGLNENSHVIEVGSNDGYMLRNFTGIPCTGVEPSAGPAREARKLGIKVLNEFFNVSMAEFLPKADLIIGNNVYAHVPDIIDFTKALKLALKPNGIITLEFPHLLRLVEQTQFDTMYHEHFSYLSLHVVSRIFNYCGLKVFDVEELPVHGGSLRVYGCHANGSAVADTLKKVLNDESKLLDLVTYERFQLRANKIKNYLLDFLIMNKLAGKTVLGFGAAAKGNTLLNYAGVKPDLLKFVCDDTPAKQHKYLPGSHIPVLHRSALEVHKCHYLLVLPWNFIDEIKQKSAYLIESGTKLVTAIPQLRVYDESTTEATDQFGRTYAA